jgi:hypothetical protein
MWSETPRAMTCTPTVQWTFRDRALEIDDETA